MAEVAAPYAPVKPSFSAMVSAPHQMLAMVFGFGLFRVWPGTWGTLAGIGLFVALQPIPLAARVFVYVVLIVASAWACQKTGEDLSSPDHNAMVIDETLGMSLTLEFVAPGMAIGAVSFLLFRFFDAYKPWPIDFVDRKWKGGFFVILDDLLAALYTILAVRFLVAPLLA
ncbi:Phosphatidylglycerophosphatase [Pseudorhizobium banfieldiae]|uniref:Phosphatidylglycerophosphatase A n=1 Tax=Pseudorhizobium banfieldiae TaxID=1125847 RepID=L0NB77_9HYPH|nr:phosphatidylglycerophosphatase A [Pseudorhizobium banfieldiae]CAD6601909.1 phosphatidylglycerophosphatase A [arsenite-oxidising bacterium NT-25]CCF18315.1 Phosphatidylglycerophosphatase [Pseudorhizobium banfieldiae]